MSLPQEVASTYQARVGSDNIRQVVYPAPNARVAAISNGVAADAWSAWVQICVATTLPNPLWLVGLECDTPVVEVFSADFEVGIGEAAGPEVGIAQFPVRWMYNAGPTDADLLPYSIFVPCVIPIRVVGSPRFVVRIRKSTGGSVAGCSVSIVYATGVGT